MIRRYFMQALAALTGAVVLPWAKGSGYLVGVDVPSPYNRWLPSEQLVGVSTEGALAIAELWADDERWGCVMTNPHAEATMPDRLHDRRWHVSGCRIKNNKEWAWFLESDPVQRTVTFKRHPPLYMSKINVADNWDFEPAAR